MGRSFDEKRGLCLITRSLPEYEALDTERHEVAITLLRAVGFLGAGFDMQTASVGAGPHIATPRSPDPAQTDFFTFRAAPLWDLEPGRGVARGASLQ